MIDYSNEIFTAVKNVMPEGVTVLGEYVETPAKFPCVTIDESNNIPSNITNGNQEYADVTYRLQVFSNKKAGKRAEARQLYSIAADVLYGMNLIGKTFVTTPTVYNANIYEIQGTFEGVIREDGKIFRR